VYSIKSYLSKRERKSLSGRRGDGDLNWLAGGREASQRGGGGATTITG